MSPGATSDDKIMATLDGLATDEMIVTEKMDGENTTIHAGGVHARSPDSRYHPSRDWLKAFAAGIQHRLDSDERIVGENLYARHSIAYDSLPSYFLGFAWIRNGIVQPWDETLARFDTLGIVAVPMLYRGAARKGLFDEIAAALDPDKQEGFVVRISAAFPESDMPRRMGKYVRANHVQSDTHWTAAPLVPNGLA